MKTERGIVENPGTKTSFRPLTDEEMRYLDRAGVIVTVQRLAWNRALDAAAELFEELVPDESSAIADLVRKLKV